MNDSAPFRYANEKIGFYIASGDQELLLQVNKLMARNGYVGIMDTAGRVQYLVDGRMGSPFAARRIMDTAGRLLRDQQEQTCPVKRCLGPAVDHVLAAHGIRPELKGFSYLRYMLLMAGYDETSLRPVSKTLYPAAATHFKVTPGQVERDIRYAMHKSDFHSLGLTGAAAICRMHDEMMREAENMAQKKTSFADPEGDEGRY